MEVLLKTFYCLVCKLNLLYVCIKLWYINTHIHIYSHTCIESHIFAMHVCLHMRRKTLYSISYLTMHMYVSKSDELSLMFESCIHT